MGCHFPPRGPFHVHLIIVLATSAVIDVYTVVHPTACASRERDLAAQSETDNKQEKGILIKDYWSCKTL